MRYTFARALLPILCVTLLLAGCLKPLITARPLDITGARSATAACAPVVGQIEHFSYRVQGSTIADIAVGATVAIIDTNTNQTLSTAVSDQDGRFAIKFSAGFAPSSNVYYLEAYKGLPVGGAPNRAGNSMARVRTLIKWEGSHWRHLHTGDSIKLSTSSTTLSVITSLRAASDSTRVDPAALLGSLHEATPEFSGAAGVTPSEFQTVRDQVVQCLAGDQDPLYRITFDLEGRNFFLIDRGVQISRVDPLVGPMGTRVTIEGTNLGVAPVVRFNGVQASASVNAVSTILTADVPVGATSGPVTVQVGTIVFNGANFAVTPWDGHNVFDAADNMYVASRRDNRIYRFDPNGALSLYVADSNFSDPRGLVVMPDNTLYVASVGRDRILKVAPDKTVTDYTTSGLSDPTGLVVSPTGDLYVANAGNGKVSRIATGTTTPTDYATGFSSPWGIAQGPGGILYVTDRSVGKVFRINPDQSVTQLAQGLDDPRGIAVDSSGNVFVACYGSHSIYRITPAGGLGVFASMPNYPGYLAFHSDGTLYVGAYLYDFIARVDRTGQVLNYWSPGHLTWSLKAKPGVPNPDLYGASGSGWGVRTQTVYRMAYNGTDYDPPAPLFKDLPNPSAIGVDKSSPNTMYIGDWNGFLFKGDIANKTYTTYAVGVGTVGDLTTDAAGNLYVAGWGNHCLYRFTGTALDKVYSRFWYLNAACFDGSGNMYVADYWYGRVLRVTPSGVISVYADNGGAGFGSVHGLSWYNGDLYVASWGQDKVYRLPGGTGTPVVYVTGTSNPNQMAFDGSGNLYVACYGNKAIKIFGADRALKATLSLPDAPRGMVMDGSGNLYVHYYNQGKIVQITPITPAVSYNAPVDFSTGVGQCLQMFLKSNGDLLLAGYSDRVVYRVPGTGGAPTTYASLPTRPGGVALDSSGDLYVTTWDAPNIYKYAAGSSTYRLWASGLRTPAGVELDEANGVAYVTDWDNGVVNMVDLTTGAISIAANSMDWPSKLRSLKGITLNAGKLYVNAWGAGVYELTRSGTSVTGAVNWGSTGGSYGGSSGAMGGLAFGAGGKLYASAWDWVNNGASPYIYYDPAIGSVPYAVQYMTNWPNLVAY